MNLNGLVISEFKFAMDIEHNPCIEHRVCFGGLSTTHPTESNF